MHWKKFVENVTLRIVLFFLFGLWVVFLVIPLLLQAIRGFAPLFVLLYVVGAVLFPPFVLPLYYFIEGGCGSGAIICLPSLESYVPGVFFGSIAYAAVLYCILHYVRARNGKS